jgi:hypothetical protein
VVACAVHLSLINLGTATRQFVGRLPSVVAPVIDSRVRVAQAGRRTAALFTIKVV